MNWTQFLESVRRTDGEEEVMRLAARCEAPASTSRRRKRKAASRDHQRSLGITIRGGYVRLVRDMVSRAPKTGYVYFIRCKNSVKIGFSASPIERFNALRTGMPDESVLLGWIPGSIPLEQELHWLYQHLRVHADRKEWFRLTPALASVIKSLATFEFKRVDAAIAENEEHNRRLGYQSPEKLHTLGKIDDR